MPTKAPVSVHIVANALFEEGDATKAISILLTRGDSAFSYHKYLRRKFTHDITYRHRQYLQRLRFLQESEFGPQNDEWHLLENLYHSPLIYQYRVETSKAAYLPTPAHDKALKMIRSMADPFYDFVLPSEIVQEGVARQQEAREIKHMKAVTVSDLQTIISKARLWRSTIHPWEMVACALILCGRRVIEVISTLEWEKHGEYTATVTGIAKQGTPDKEVVIPLLCRYEDFDELMLRIRAVDLATTSHSHRLRPAFIRRFGKWYNHSERRNIYGEAGYRMRTETGFFPDMSKVMWIDNALCHTSNVIQQASNLTYQSLVFTDGGQQLE